MNWIFYAALAILVALAVLVRLIIGAERRQSRRVLHGKNSD